MIDLNKPSFIEEHIAGVIGGVIGSVNGMQSKQKAAEARYEQSKRQQDAELKLYVAAHKK